MAHTGPIIILDDDTDDHHMLTEALEQLNITNKPIFFVEGEDAINYLLQTTEQPFLIFSDINMPKMNGLEFRQKILDHPVLKKKSVPFIFFSTSDNSYAVAKAYDEEVQGFFQKPESFEKLKALLKMITEYWKHCKHPNTNVL